MNYPAHENLTVGKQGKALYKHLAIAKQRYKKHEAKGEHKPLYLYYVIERLDRRGTQNRWIRFYLPHKNNLGWIDVTLGMAELTGLRYKEGSLRVGGCGMDMIFAAYACLPAELGYDFIRHEDLHSEIHFSINQQKQKETA